MAELLLGPLLRYVSTQEATIWVETDLPCTVRVLDASAPTFTVWGHHYALVVVRNLTPATTVEYAVYLDAEQKWPAEDGAFLPSVIRTLGVARPSTVLFGSCRAAGPHEPPYNLTPDEDERGKGVDALRAHGLRMLDQPPDEWPDIVMLLGDQVYADDPSPRTADAIDVDRSGDSEEPPADIVADFEEYTKLYTEAWTPDVERWMLSVVPSAMIFDDHDMIDDWNISSSWVTDIRTEPWWEEHIIGGLVSYWIYQHLGNLAPDQIEREGILAELVASDDAGGVLRRWAQQSEEYTPVPGGYSFNFTRHLGDVHLVVLDSRNGRVLVPGARAMLDEEEWAFVEEATAERCRHLVIATSLPMFVPGGLHALQQWNEAVCDGRWGRQVAWFGEKLRRGLDMEDWAAFDRSFRAIESLLLERACAADAPSTISILGGDIHFSYVAELTRRDGVGMASRVHQLVSSPIRNVLAARDRRCMRFAASSPGRWLAERLQSWAKRPPSLLTWELDDDPVFGNTLGVLHFDGDRGSVRITTAFRSEDGTESLRDVIVRPLSDDDVGSPVASTGVATL